MMSFNDRIKTLVREKPSITLEELEAILRKEGYPESDIKLLPWALL